MADSRFFTNAGPFALDDLALSIGGRVMGSRRGKTQVADIATLEDAGPGHVALFADARYRDAFHKTAAGVVITSAELAQEPPADGICLIIVDEPRLAYTEMAWLFYPGATDLPTAGSDFSAPEASFGDDCFVNASAIVGPGAVIGARAHIDAHVVIGHGVVIGDDCIIGPNVSLTYAIVGSRVHLHSGAVIGASGFGFVPSPRGLRRVPQLGRAIIEDDVEIGANSTIDRGAIGDTIIGRGTVIDNLIQVGHNVRIGRSCVLAAQTGIAGSTKIGDGVMIGGQTGIADHLTIGSGAKIVAKSGVTRDVEPGTTVGGYPAVPVRDWHRQTLALRNIARR